MMRVKFDKWLVHIKFFVTSPYCFFRQKEAYMVVFRERITLEKLDTFGCLKTKVYENKSKT